MWSLGGCFDTIWCAFHPADGLISGKDSTMNCILYRSVVLGEA
jgi:hypothetical protein